MKRSLQVLLSAAVVSFSLLSPAVAQNYIVNGHPATPKETELLASWGMADGEWMVDGWGIRLVKLATLSAAEKAAADDAAWRKCRYVFGVEIGDCAMVVSSR